MVDKNALNKYNAYTMAQIKLHFCGIASPEGGIALIIAEEPLPDY
jgi:hypothetical protein